MIHCALSVLISLSVLLAARGAACEFDRLPNMVSPWYQIEKPEFYSKLKSDQPGIILSDSSHSFDALHYRLDINFPMESSYFEGAMTLTFEVVDDSINEVSLDMVHLIAESAIVNGYFAGFTRTDSAIIVSLNGYHYTNDTLIMTIYYHDNTTNRGYYYYARDAYTMAEPEDARWWFPCFDEPWDKATSEIYATVPEDYYVGSNGYLESVFHNTNDHTKIYHWVNDDPIATYLINLIMADYAVWEDIYISATGDTIPILNMVYTEDSVMAAYDFANVPAMMEIFSDLFYPYPFNKYGQGAVSPFPYGAMEHQTMTTMNRNWITGDRSAEAGYAHELAHMWWGDFITLADWRHMWLNEGFATYSSGLFLEEFYSHEEFLYELLLWKDIYIEHGNTYGHAPIYDPAYLFSVRVYFKGAWVLHMLRGIMGDNLFYQGLNHYASSYAYGNADTWNFKNSMEAVSNMDLDWFFDQWVFGQAHPIYQYSWSYTGTGPYNVELQIHQTQTEAPPFRSTINIRINSANGTFDFYVENQNETESYSFAVSEEPASLELDPDHWILKEVEEVTAIEQEISQILPDMIELNSPYPNPFNGSVNISFSIHGLPKDLTVEIFDIIGRKVRGLISGVYTQGYYIVQWDGLNDDGEQPGSGAYFVLMRTESGSQSKKILYLR